MNSPTLEETVLDYVNDSIGSYLDKKWEGFKTGKEPKTKHIILDRIFPTERRIRSIIGGLETSLGTTFWEKLAKYIAQSNNFTLKDTREFQKPENLPDSISQLVQDWRTKRLVPSSDLGTTQYLKELRHLSRNIDRSAMPFSSISAGDGIDLWLVKDGVEYIFDIKTVQINAGNGNSFCQKVMEWYAYRILAEPELNLKVAMAFPYSPHKPFTIESWWRVEGRKAYPLKHGDDALVQEEFWDLLSGESNTWKRMLVIFESLKDSDFAEKYHGLFYPDTE